MHASHSPLVNTTLSPGVLPSLCRSPNRDRRGPPARREGKSRGRAPGRQGLVSLPSLVKSHSLERITMDREFSSDIGLVIGDRGEKLKTRSATEMSSWSEGCGNQGDDAAEARARLEKQAGQGGWFESRPAEARSVPSASFTRSSMTMRGSSSYSRNLRSLYMSDRALGQLRDRNRNDDFQSKTLALLTSISQ
eukprot:scaffold189641_cov18-Tisochrysis_lutea.AAC.1